MSYSKLATSWLIKVEAICRCHALPCACDRLNLELFKARDVMCHPVITITSRESVAHLAHLLLETTHGGFPVVKYFEDSGCEVAYGLLTRCVVFVVIQWLQSGLWFNLSRFVVFIIFQLRSGLCLFLLWYSGCEGAYSLLTFAFAIIFRKICDFSNSHGHIRFRVYLFECVTFDICHLMTQLLKLHVVTLTYLFKVKHM